MGLFGIPLLPDTSQPASAPGMPAMGAPENPSFLEMLANVAGSFYSGDPRYASAGNALGTVGDIFGHMRGRRNQQRQNAIIAQQLPDLAPYLQAGIEPKFGDIVDLQKQAAEQKFQQNLPAQLTEIAKIADPKERATRVFGLFSQRPGWNPSSSLAEQAFGLGDDTAKFPGTNQILAGKLFGTPRAPQSQEEYTKLADSIQGATADAAGQRVKREVEARNNAQGMAPYMVNPYTRKLVDWGYDPKGIQPGDPVVGEATEATGIDASRSKITKAERDVYRTATESEKNISRLEQHIATMQKSGKPLDGQTIYNQWLKYDATQSQNPLEKGAGAYVLGPPEPAYQRLFSLIGQTRNRLAPVYMPPGMRSQKFLQQSQQHLPVEGAPIENVVEAINALKPMVTMAKNDLAPEQDPRRQKMIAKLRGQMDSHTGKPVSESRASYLVDKLLGLTPDQDPTQRETIQQPALPAE